MNVIKRLMLLLAQRSNAALSRAEDPIQSLDLAYRKQLEILQAVRSSVAEVLTSQKRIELQETQLERTRQKHRADAVLAVQSGNEALARLALARANALDLQLDELRAEISDLKQHQASLERTAEHLRMRVEAFRAQKELIAAKYVSAKATTAANEAIGGITTDMQDINAMVERAKEKSLTLDARSQALGELIQRGALDGVGTSADANLDQRLRIATSEQRVDNQLAQIKTALADSSNPGIDPKMLS